METFDPLTILGCTADEAREWLGGRRVTPGEVEAAAALHYRWRAHLHENDSYWVTIGQAARLAGVTRTEMNRLVASRRLPSIQHISGVRLMRRDRVLQYAAARGVATCSDLVAGPC